MHNLSIYVPIRSNILERNIMGGSHKWRRIIWQGNCHYCRIPFLVMVVLCHVLEWNRGYTLIQTTKIHQLYEVTPTKHNQLHFLNTKRLNAPQLVFWNGIGVTGEKVFILATKEIVAKHTPDFEKHKLKLKVKYNTVKITYEESNKGKPNDDGDKDNAGSDEEDIPSDPSAAAQPPSQNFEEEMDDIEERLHHGEVLDDQTEAEMIILKRRNKFNSGNSLYETVGVIPRTHGLLPVAPMKASNGRTLPINSGILYRIQGIQTLIQGNFTTKEKGEWVATAPGGTKKGYVPHVGEYVSVSIVKKRSGSNPFITSEEEPLKWKNTEYKINKTKAALWMFVPTEVDRFYEIRNRNYPASLLVWNYDVDEGEFVLNLETRREYLKRYSPEGELRKRALFSFQLISETYDWELRHDRPKFYLMTTDTNHVYSYESTKKKCTLLVVRNSATQPYTPEKTDKFNRQLDMFYITRLNLTGMYTASIFSFMYEKSIVDVFAKSAQEESVKELTNFELANRSPIKSWQYVLDEVSTTNEYTFKFKDGFKQFQWVTIEAHIPSFGVAPIILTGVVGDNTNTKAIRRKFEKIYKISDKVGIPSGYSVNASVIFQSIKDYSNQFSALMEVTEPADRLYWDQSGRPQFIRLSMPGSFIAKTWGSKANFSFDRVIEKREAAVVVQIRGTMVGSYGLRAFTRKAATPYGIGVVSCERGS